MRVEIIWPIRLLQMHLLLYVKHLPLQTHKYTDKKRRAHLHSSEHKEPFWKGRTDCKWRVVISLLVLDNKSRACSQLTKHVLTGRLALTNAHTHIQRQEGGVRGPRLEPVCL